VRTSLSCFKADPSFSPWRRIIEGNMVAVASTITEFLKMPEGILATDGTDKPTITAARVVTIVYSSIYFLRPPASFLARLIVAPLKDLDTRL